MAALATFTFMASGLVLPSGSAGAVDFNLDSRPDVIVRTTGGALLLYKANTARTGFTTPVTIGTSGWNSFTALVSPGDFSGDGRPDLIVRTTDGALKLYKANTARTGFTAPVTVGTSGWNAFSAIIAPGDFSGDGRPDLIARTTAGALKLYKANTARTGFTTPVTVGTSGWNPHTLLDWTQNSSGNTRSAASSRNVSSAGVEFIAAFEGFVDHPYNDASGHCTIGYGHLIHLGGCTGTDTTTWGTISQAEGRDLLQGDLASRVAHLRSELGSTPLYQYEFDALLSFMYNIGNNGFDSSSVRADLRTSPPSYSRVPDHLMLWTAGDGGVRYCGLYRRRYSEGTLFTTGRYDRLSPTCPPGYEFGTPPTAGLSALIR